MTRHTVAIRSWPNAVRYTLFASAIVVGARGVFRFHSRTVSIRTTLGRTDVAAGCWIDGVCCRAGVPRRWMEGGHRQARGHYNLVVCLAPPLLGFLCWLVLARGGPWVYTRIAGVEFEEVHVMQTAYVRTARTCKYRLSGGPLAHRFPGHLCIDEALYRRHPEQQMPVRLRGQRSALGMRIAVVAEDA
ncbi:hypothetical protein LL963_14645 [Xanthomonas campestris pv. esculenti]|nr:hypothetical protein [Xanthomonas campestris pv. esculenti]